MIEKIIENVINSMMPYLDQSQLEHLNNVLFMNFHGIKVKEECTQLIDTGLDGNDAKVKMFILSKKAINRQDNSKRDIIYRSAI